MLTEAANRLLAGITKSLGFARDTQKLCQFECALRNLCFQCLSIHGMKHAMSADEQTDEWTWLFRQGKPELGKLASNTNEYRVSTRSRGLGYVIVSSSLA
jgi:hypothetical protein